MHDNDRRHDPDDRTDTDPEPVDIHADGTGAVMLTADDNPEAWIRYDGPLITAADDYHQAWGNPNVGGEWVASDTTTDIDP